MGKVDQVEAKANKLFDDLQVMGSTNTRLGSKNVALQLKVETLVSAEAVLKIKLVAIAKDVSQAERRMLEAHGLRRTAEDARKWVEERAAMAKETIASINRDFNAMVLEKDKQLVVGMCKLEKLKEKLAMVTETRAVRLYRRNFPSTLLYTCLATRFMETGSDLLTEKI
ncbi:hypothetical protein Adt_12206 [Abeliophyllum distichum]|uniref:Uncharacterized protein n=1 Tax=Abeliophyllum distichum TaxID=126358 RepID=A0ABD1UQD5_9LAMI